MSSRRFLFAVCVLALSVAPGGTADERTIWKYDKGTFEKQANGKWVQKEGDTTHEYAEKASLPDHIEVFDAKRKIAVRLNAGDAVVTQQGKKAALEKLKGEWVTADGSRLVDKFTFWKYEKGTFERQADGKWIQKEGDKTYTLREDERLPDRTDLYDTTRKIAIRIKKDGAEISAAGKGVIEKLTGEWVAVEAPKAKPDEKRTVWKYDKGTFERTADGKWLQKEGDTTREYTEKSVPDDFIEIEDKGRKTTVRLGKNLATIRVVGGKVKDNPPIKGGWVDAAQAKNPDPKNPDPKAEAKKSAEGHFAEVRAVRRTEQPGGLALAPSPDGKTVALLHGPLFEGRFGIYHFETKKFDPSWKLPNYVTHVLWSGDGKSLAAVAPSTELKNGKMSKVFVWDTASWDQRAEFDFDGTPFSLALSADGNTVAVTGPMLERGQLVKVWDVGAKKEILSQKIDANNTDIALTANGKVLALGAGGTEKVQGTVAFIDLPSGKSRGSMKALSKFIMSADGNTLVEWTNGAGNLTVNVWNTKAAAKGPRVIKLDKWTADKLIFINNGQHLAIAGGLTQDEVKVFDLKTMTEYDSIKLSKPPKGIARKYMVIEASPDSSHLLIYATGDTLLRVWSTPFGPKDAAPMPKEKDKP